MLNEETIQEANDERVTRASAVQNAFKSKDFVFIARAFMAGSGVFVVCSKTLYKYQEEKGTYKKADQDDFGRDFLAWCAKYGSQRHYNSHNEREVYNALLKIPDVREIDAFDDYDFLICLRNGVYDFKDKLFEPHNPNLFFISRIEIDYNAEAFQCDTFMNYLETTFTNDDGKPDTDTIKMILQIMAYFIYPKLKMEKMFFLGGEGSNGKSVFQSFLKIIFGPTGFSSLSMSQMSNPDGFTRVPLVGSRINISTETKNKEVDSEEIKKIVSGEEITINPKNSKPFNYKPNTKLIASGNHNLYFGDTTAGITRRFVPIEFKNTFCDPDELVGVDDPASKRMFPKKDLDIMMDNFKKELPAIFNFLMISLQELEDQEWHIHISAAAKRTKDEYKEQTDSLGTWLKENFECRGEADYNCALTFSEMRDEYLNWYYKEVSTMTPNLNANTFTKKLRGLFGNFKGMVKKTVDGDCSRRFLLIRKEKYDDNTSSGDVRRAKEQGHDEMGAPTAASLFDGSDGEGSNLTVGTESGEIVGDTSYQGK